MRSLIFFLFVDPWVFIKLEQNQFCLHFVALFMLSSLPCCFCCRALFLLLMVFFCWLCVQNNLLGGSAIVDCSFFAFVYFFCCKFCSLQYCTVCCCRFYDGDVSPVGRVFVVSACFFAAPWLVGTLASSCSSCSAFLSLFLFFFYYFSVVFPFSRF